MLKKQQIRIIQNDCSIYNVPVQEIESASAWCINP